MKKITKMLLFVIMITNISITAFSQANFDYTLPNTEGEETLLDDIKGEQFTVLDFWASWCKPCLKAIPKLIELSDKFKDKGVVFVGINTDSPRNSSKVSPLSQSLGITYPVLLDSEQELMNDFLISNLPTLIILNKKGEVVYNHIGYTNGDEKIIETKINKLLNEN